MIGKDGWVASSEHNNINYITRLKVRMLPGPPKKIHWKLECHTIIVWKNLPKFYLSVRIMLVNVDILCSKIVWSNLPTCCAGATKPLFFVGLECLRSICPQNSLYIYLFIYLYLYPTSTKSLKKAGRGIKTWFWASFCRKNRF